jgi:hypothetical protein
MAKQRAVSPGMAGAVSDAVSAVKDYMRAGREENTGFGNKDEDSQLRESNSSNVASNAGRQAQSTDASNQY